MTPGAEARFLALVRARRLRPPQDRFLARGVRRLVGFFADGALREVSAARPHRLQTLDPRARLLAVVVYLVSVSLATTLPVLLAHALVTAAVLAVSRIRLREVLRGGLLVAVGFSILMAAPATLNLVRDGQILVPLVIRSGAWHLGPLTVPAVIGVTREGLLTAATFCLRVLASVGMVLWLTLGTRWSDVLAGLSALGLPALVVQIAGMTVRYLHLLLRQSHEVHLGKRSRTVCRRPLVAEHAWVGSRIGMMWLQGLHLMQEVGDAMTARGFTGELPRPGRAGLAAADWLFLSLIVLACLGTRLA